MKKFILILLLSYSFYSFATERADIIVDKSGSGDYETITDALNSIPDNNSSWKTILIKNGIYDEHVMIKNNFIALIGEDRHNTRIEHNLSRTSWKNGGGNGSNTGCGVINIYTDRHDIVIGNMTVKNTYNYDSDSGEDYTEVIRSETGTTRIWVIDCDVLCKWKDTFAPWGKDNGMYYVENCTFRGSIDAFCPRGWCYALNCRFIETRDSSPIWHEGVSGLNQKLVIQGGSVHSEKNKNTKLQNQQGSPSFYYLDVNLSDSIGSQGSSGPSYYYNVKGNSTYSWYKNNLTLEERKKINARQTFTSNGILMWDPEGDLPPVLSSASMTQPYHKQYCVDAGPVTLKWIGGRNATGYNLYFGTTVNPEIIAAEIKTTHIEIETEANKNYYWRIDVITDEGIIRGKTKVFSTGTTLPPDPSDGNMAPSVTLKDPGASSFDAPATIQLEAIASDPDGIVKKVDFYANNSLIGTADSEPFSINYTFRNPGIYSVTARAFDDYNASTTSSSVSVTVNGSIIPPDPNDYITETFEKLISGTGENQLSSGSDVNKSFMIDSYIWNVGKSRLNTTASNSRSGSNSIRLYYDGTASITTPELADYQTFSFWVRSAKTKDVNIDVSVSVNGNGFISVHNENINSTTYKEIRIPICEIGKVKITITNKGGASGSTDYCLYVDDISFLPYKEPATDITTPIKDKTILSVEYFDLAGRKISERSRGILIKQTRYNDKSIEREKIVIK